MKPFDVKDNTYIDFEKEVFHGYMLLMISVVKKLLEHFMKKNCKRLVKKNLE